MVIIAATYSPPARKTAPFRGSRQPKKSWKTSWGSLKAASPVTGGREGEEEGSRTPSMEIPTSWASRRPWRPCLSYNIRRSSAQHEKTIDRSSLTKAASITCGKSGLPSNTMFPRSLQPKHDLSRLATFARRSYLTDRQTKGSPIAIYRISCIRFGLKYVY